MRSPLHLAPSSFTLIALSALSFGQQPALQADWFQSPINGNWYGVDYTPRTWTDSEDLAVSLGGHLATIRNEAEQNWIETFVGAYQLGPAGSAGLWFGLYKSGRSWLWASGEPPTDYDNFADDQPDGNGDFAQIVGPNGCCTQFTWDDVPGGGFLRPLIELPTKPEVGWSWPWQYDVGTGTRWGCLADLDGDQDLDCVLTYHGRGGVYGEALLTFINDGFGRFETGPVIDLGLTRPHDVAAVDHDQDGDQDLLVAIYHDEQLVLVENAGGLNFDGGSKVLGGDFHNVVTVDANNDGLADLVATEYSGTVQLSLGLPGGGFGGGSALDVSSNITHLAYGELDGDGNVDFAVVGYNSNVFILAGDGSGGLSEKGDYSVPGAYGVAIGDIDGDSDMDVCVSCKQAPIKVLLNDGSGGFAGYDVPLPRGGTEDAKLIDLDGDNDLDIVAPASGLDQVYLLYNDGTGGFTEVLELLGNEDARYLLVGDLDGDAALDLLVTPDSNSDQMVVHLGSGFLDCNDNGVPDSEDIASGTSADCDGNGIPDECQIADDPSLDCDWNSVLDTCDLQADPSLDCDGDDVLDSCQIDADPSLDCDGNGALDTCDLLSDPSLDCDGDSVLDSCQITWDPGLDCDGDQVLDSCQLFNDPSLDCDGDQVLDTCQIAGDPSLDQNGNGILDSCECAFENYCSAAWNSTDQPAVIGAQGSASISANDLTLTVSGAPLGQFGLFFYGAGEDFFFVGDGAICVKPPLNRVYPVILTDGSGMGSLALDLGSPPFSAGGGQIAPFETWHFQFWFRDPPGGPAGFNFSDGLAVTFCP